MLIFKGVYIENNVALDIYGTILGREIFRVNRVSCY